MVVNRMTRYGWIYQADDSEKYFPFKVIAPEEEKREIPATLYKYYSLSQRSVEAIEGQFLYAPHPYQLNDLYDCHESLIQFDNIQVITNIFEKIIPREEIEKGFKAKDKDFLRTIQLNFNLLVYSKWGILSFTEDHLSIPMWSYYALNKGFVVEFNYKEFDFSTHGPFQVNYQESIEPVSVEKGLPLCVLYQSNIKTKQWEHEKEWRLLPEKFSFMEMPGFPIQDGIKFADRIFKYNISTIKRIILGNRFFDNNDKELLDLRDGSFRIELKHDVGLKGRLLKAIINYKIPAFIIVRNTDKFILSEVPVIVEDDGKMDKKYISPISK